MSNDPIKNKGKNKGWANLKPAKKGEVRNPNGRPKKDLAIADILNSIGDEEITNQTTGEVITKRRAVLHTIYSAALKGDLNAAKFIADRTEGKPIETVRTQEIEKDTLIEI